MTEELRMGRSSKGEKKKSIEWRPVGAAHFERSISI